MSRTIMFWQIVMVLLVCRHFAVSQQFPGMLSSVAFLDFDLSNLSDFGEGCIQALNFTIDHPVFLHECSESYVSENRAVSA